MENRPLVKFIGNYIWDSSGVFFHILTSEDIDDVICRFTLFFVQKYSCLYNKKKITRGLEDMNFYFLVVKTIFYSLAALLRKILFLPLENEIQIQRLHYVQNSAAHILTGTRKYDNITPILRELHCLPVAERIHVKI